MLSEFALSPAIFRTESYSGGEAVADVCLRALKRPILDDFIVRDLHLGEWHKQLLTQRDRLHPKGKEFLKQLKPRLVTHAPAEAICPINDEQWEIEAVASHLTTPLSGMIFSQDAKTNRYMRNPLVSCPEKLSSAEFWKQRPCSRRIPRTIQEYSKLLESLLRHANFIAFIDPHLDPSQDRYGNFIQLLTSNLMTERFSKPISKPTIQVHRIAWLGSGREKKLSVAEIEKTFRDEWSARLEECKISVEFFLWNDLHDRFVATNLISMSWSNGFDISKDASARVTVTRLSRSDRDDLQKEFSENSTMHSLIGRFTIGKGILQV